MTFKIVTLSILVLTTLFHLFLHILDFKSRNNPIPECCKDIYDESSYLKWKKYHFELFRLDIIFEVINFVAVFALLISNVLATIASYAFNNVYVQSFVALAVYMGISFILGIIKDYIGSLVIEEKYGFNKSSKKTFFIDKIKEVIISCILTFGLLALFILIHTSIKDFVLLVFAIVMVVIILFVVILQPVFSKIFNKFTPLEDGTLKEKLLALLNKYGYKVKGIFVMDASKRSTKSNAYFSGMGKTKNIVLYDTLLKSMSEDEIVAVFAHELGHGLHKDIFKNFLISFINIVLIVVLAWLLVKFEDLYVGYGFGYINYGFAFIILSEVVMSFVALFINLIQSAMSRKHEYAADAHAVKEGYGEALKNALKVLARENFANLSPNPLVVLLSYSHPTISQRIQAIDKLMNK